MRYFNPKTLAYERLSWWMNHKPSIVMYDIMQSKHFVSTMKFLKSLVGFYVDKKKQIRLRLGWLISVMLNVSSAFYWNRYNDE